MRWNHIFQRLVAVLALAIGLSSYGCKDTVSVSEDVQVPLAGLTITPGALQPAFFSNTTNYTVDAPTSADKVTVSATPRDNTTTVTINGTIITQRSVPLGAPGSTTIITIVLDAQNGAESTYTVNVTRLLSSDNNLFALDVTPGNLDPAFDSGTEDYTVNVGVLIDSITISATKSDPTAMMLLGSTPVPPGTASDQATIPLGGPGTTTPVTITVTAPNGSAKTYTITVNRAALSGNNNLSGLIVTADSLDQHIDLNTPPPYTVNVATNVINVTVTATLEDTNATLTINNQGTSSGVASAPITLGEPGSNTDISVVVTAPNGNPKAYPITVHRATPEAPSAPTVAPDLISEDDSGFLPGQDSDNITNVTTPRFQIPQPGASEIPSLYVNGVKVEAIFDPVTNTLKPTTALSDGTYSITYTVANAGGESAQSPLLIVTIDTSFPLPL
ncbi:MAG: cadherin-like beta sandwich domain-containing protein [Nitrospira sp.]|nr:cadherin-like beta sandwich domain-containing protein [Nitrospira sp.]